MSAASIIIFLGPPGAGKGTQAVMLAENLGMLHLSTGEMFRQAIENQTVVGKQIKAVYDAGNLISDEMTVKLVEERLSQSDVVNGVILDGFPRNLTQAAELEKILKKLDISIKVALDVSVPEEVLFDRIRRRSQEAGRSDDSQDVLANRYQVYLRETAPISAFYEKQGILRRIDGLGTVEEVSKRLREQIS